MKVELYRGKVIDVGRDGLVFETGDGVRKSFVWEGFLIDEQWLLNFLGEWVEYTVVDGLVTEVRPV